MVIENDLFVPAWGVSFASAGCLPDHDGWLGVFSDFDDAWRFVEELRESGEWDESGLYSFSVDLFDRVDELGVDVELWRDVFSVVGDAVLVAWDGCHKIYVALDEGEAQWFRESDGYQTFDDVDSWEVLMCLADWWEMSCFLRFVSGVRGSGDGGSEYVTLIGQGAEYV